uniref:J domain-containing protein n=1 Tax=Picocystis salinarum TaxID=88271 RepID=A0A7S3UDX2_9CHLO|mmetsp:Transcript_5721/g.35630  ORF Transcript_5721/g.35630 Transcript_5721/m.35630 type:complete len:141 (-) Transcript_5721:1017-1439(-)
MAARILANLILAGTEILVRVAIQSYKQTVVRAWRRRSGRRTRRASNRRADRTFDRRAEAQRNGSAQAAATGGRSFLRKTMTAEEAYMILGLDSNATREEIMKKYQHLFDVNEKHGSFYLQSKVYRARERLEQELKRRGEV